MIREEMILVKLLALLSKAFDSLDYEFLIEKLNAYGFSLPALRLIHVYLSYKKQRTRVNNSYREWFAVRSGVPQGSILGLEVVFPNSLLREEIYRIRVSCLLI